MNFGHIPIILIALGFVLPAYSMRCPSGTFQTENATCQICPPGTWRNSRNRFRPRDAPCIPCKPGFFNPFAGAVGVDLCIRCPINTFAASPGSTSCTPCPPGTSSNIRAQTCLRCGPGTAASRNSNTCEQCQEGFYSSQPTNSRCMPCPLPKTSPPGATSRSQCTFCPPGQSAFRGPCKDCRPGTANAQPTERCDGCRPGEFSNTRGAIKCKLCPPATFQRRRFSTRCDPCSNGTTTVGFGNTICREIGQPCNTGFFEDDKGDCRLCPKGYRLNLIKRRCEKCPAGSVSPGGVQTICVRCENGQIPNVLNSFCGCSNGQFPDRMGGCKPCPPGTSNRKILRTGTPCLSCASGTFASEPGATRCTKCPPRQFAPDFRATRCSPCPEGTISGRGFERGSLCISKTTRCPRGYRRRFVGSRNIFFRCFKVACTLESTEEDIGNTCALCEPFEFLDSENQRCRLCPFDEISLGGLDTTCEKCPAGRVRDTYDPLKCSCRGLRAAGRGLRDGACVPCPAGSFGSSDSEFCAPCKRGTFANRSGMEACKECAIDFFADKEGATRCKRCPSGTISDRRPGGISCIPSPV